MRKKVAIVANSTWNIYNFRLSLIKRLKAEGYRIVVIAPVDEYIDYLNQAGVTRHIPLQHLSAQGRHPGKDMLLLWELYRIYRRERPDLILHYTIKPNIYGNLAARLAGIPVISTITGLGYTFLHATRAVSTLVRRLYRYSLRSAARVAFHNVEDRTLFLDEGLVEWERSLVIPGSGVNTNHFRPLSLPESDHFTFMYVGRLLSDKGLPELVEAMRRLRRRYPLVECWVIGELSPDNPAALPKEQVLEWMENGWIRYFGRTRDVRRYLKHADALVFPSHREGMPRAVLEAMAMAKPVITTDAPGCRDAVAAGRNGLLVPIGDAEALLTAMETVIELSPAEREAMGRRSRRRVLKVFDDKIITERYVELIREVVHVPEGVVGV